MQLYSARCAVAGRRRPAGIHLALRPLREDRAMSGLPCTIDPETMAAYARHVDAYARMAEDRCDPAIDLRSFIAALPAGRQPVLDWGSGCGETAALLISQGVACIAVDASPEMAAVAARLGVRTRIEPFEALAEDGAYRGIWATASLCHVRRADLPAILALAYRALVPRGILHVNVKQGDGDRRARLGRYFCLWTPEALARVIAAAGFEVKFAISVEGPSLTDGTETYAIVGSRRPAAREAP